MRRPFVPAGPWLVASFVAFARYGAWQALLPELADATGLSSGPLGAILSLGFAASFPAILAGRTSDRWGTGKAAALTASVLAAGVLALAALPTPPGLVVAVLLLGASATPGSWLGRRSSASLPSWWAAGARC